MNTKDLIPLNSSITGIADGKPVTMHETRTVQQEIDRLREAGMHDAAQRLEDSCTDSATDRGLYVSIDPTSSKPHGHGHGHPKHKKAD